MKKSASVSASLVLLALGGIATPAYADSAEARLAYLEKRDPRWTWR